MNFLKKLFTRVPEEVIVKSIELEEWLESISTDVLDGINQEIRRRLNEIQGIKKEIKQKLVDLNNAKLLNPDISEREKHVMRGNRENYIRRTGSFIDEIKLPEFNYDQLQLFCNNFETMLREFNTVTSKGYFVLTNFFNKEMKEIVILIKKLENNTLKILNLLKSKEVKHYNFLHNKISEFNKSSVESKKLVKEIKELEVEIEDSEDKKSSFMEKKDSLKTSKDFNQFNKYENEKKNIDDKLSRLGFKLNNSLKSIDKVLRKFMHGSLQEKIISEYLDDPVSALDRDINLEILKVLNKLKQAIKKGHLEVKDKQKHKILKNIERINKTLLESLREEFHNLVGEKQKYNEKLKKLTIMMDYKELQYQMEHIHDKIKRLSDELSEKKHILTNLNFEQKHKRLEKAFSEFTGDNIIIVK